MFTGIIQSVGKIVTVESRGGDARIVIDSGKMSMADVNLGDSIAVNGVCLTVVDKTDTGFTADISNETLSRTTLKQLQAGSSANLEMALTPDTRLGGHLVSGHVDGEGEVTRR
ncbi:MAG: riboflavin synthase, partial [Gammaproteobacteria bacterium]